MTHRVNDLRLNAAKRMLAIREAQESLLRFTQLRMPDTSDPDNPDKSQFEATPLARLLCQIIEKAVSGKGKKRIAVSVGPQFGKALHVDTPIPTPQGFTRIGDLQVGAEVFDERGQVCRVVAKTPVWRDRPLIEVRSDDGFSVLADEEHEWVVRRSRKRGGFAKHTTRELAAAKIGGRNPLLQLHGALELPEVDLPIDPYVLGAWLGDGTTQGAVITAPGEDGRFIERQVQDAGFRTRRHSDPKNFGVLGMHALLRKHNLRGAKHIPHEYLRASKAQRLALLQGLIDTDGYVNPSGGVEFCTTDPVLALDTRELVLSLGAKCHMYVGRATLYGKDCGAKYRIFFFLPDAARLPRKRKHCRAMKKCAGRYLTFKEAGRGDTVCIEVDAPSHQFLCGEGMMPTCNSEILSRSAPAWVQGRFPAANQILGTYNQPFANEFGDAVREIMRSPTFAQVFPQCKLRREMVELLMTEAGGKIAFVGRGGSGTGKPADFFWVDDPIKDDAEAQSDTIREETWKWFNRVAMTRCHSKSVIVVVHTRWHQDDLIGRLCDPEHPERDKQYKNISKRWDYYSLPAVIDDPKLAKALGLTLEPQTNPDVISMFGARPMTSLWPGRKSLEFLAEAKNMDPPGFSALYMGKPTPDEGDYFKADWLVEYEPDDLPENLTIYGASDHAVSIKQGRDYTVIGCVGVDEKDNLWVLPDLMRDRIETDKTVDELIHQFKTHDPALWWMEGELISKAFGPFLYKRMQEERVYTAIDSVNIAKDKRAMARSIQGRMQMRKVRFPRFAHWWPEAKQELLRFDSGAHDDFVTWLSLIGHGLHKQLKPDDAVIEDVGPPAGSVKWMLQQTQKRVEREKRETALAGW